jgi:hypothetical protein
MRRILISAFTLSFLAASALAQNASPTPAPQHAAEPGSPLAKYALVVSTISLLTSFVTGYFQFYTHRTKKPVVAISMVDLPPYPDEQRRTVINIKNVGTAATTRRVDITVSCSWMPFLSYRLNLPTAAYCLEPNEEYWWRFRMDDNIVPNSVVTVTVRDAQRDSWKLQEQINPPVPPVLPTSP